MFDFQKIRARRDCRLVPFSKFTDQGAGNLPGLRSGVGLGCLVTPISEVLGRSQKAGSSRGKGAEYTGSILEGYLQPFVGGRNGRSSRWA